jgi:multidrug efflux system membrane fusion protein
MATVVVLAVGTTVAAATGFGVLTDDGRSSASSTLPPATATVTRQTLIDTQTESGTLGHGDITTVNGRLSGTVTALPAIGTTVRRGQAVAQIDDKPVVLLYGPLPAYRALSAGIEGDDVLQFERNLWALGYRGFTVDDSYTASTAAAVQEWQDDLGLTDTGTVELGRVVFAAGPIRVGSQKATVGATAGPGAGLIGATSTARVATVELDITDARLVAKGVAVTVTLPTGKTVKGKIAKSVTVTEPASGQEPATTKIDVTIAIADQKALAGLDEGSVDVGFTAAERPDVLAVPVAALLALAEGGYGVQVVDGGSTRIVAVETGLFAAGRVEVSGDGVTEGLTVGMPS